MRSYIRTKAIREKQRKTMLEVVKSYDFKSINKKRKKTIKENGIKIGRPKGSGGRPYNGWYKKCLMCDNCFRVTPSTDRERKHCSRKCHASNPNFIKRISKVSKKYHNSNKFKIECKRRITPNTPLYKIYQGKVHRLSEKTYQQYKHLINPSGYTRTICGVVGGYQLDHIIPVKQCFIEGVSLKRASSLNNLRIIPWRDNLRRNKKC